MISAIVRCYSLNFMLARVLKNLSDIDFILLAVCNFTDTQDKSNVEEIVKGLKQNNIYCVYFPKMEQRDLFNSCIKRLTKLGSEIILINDADEILLKRDRNKIITKMRENLTDFDAVNVSVIDYSEMDCSEAHEMRTHKPVVAVKPYVEFNGNRSVEQGALMADIKLHHFGYAMEPEDLYWKLNNLWYERESAQKIINSSVEEFEAPIELLEVMNVTE